jgi:hypothetical protein
MQETNRWDFDLTFGIENKPGFYFPDQLRDIYQTLDLIEFE